MISIVANLPKAAWYRKYLEALNVFSNDPVTDQEIEVIYQIYRQGGSVNVTGRKQIRQSMKITNLNLNNYISTLRGKGVVIDTEHGITLHKSMLVLLTEPFELKIMFNESN